MIIGNSAKPWNCYVRMWQIKRQLAHFRGIRAASIHIHTSVTQACLSSIYGFVVKYLNNMCALHLGIYFQSMFHLFQGFALLACLSDELIVCCLAGSLLAVLASHQIDFWIGLLAGLLDYYLIGWWVISCFSWYLCNGIFFGCVFGIVSKELKPWMWTCTSTIHFQCW